MERELPRRVDGSRRRPERPRPRRLPAGAAPNSRRPERRAGRDGLAADSGSILVSISRSAAAGFDVTRTPRNSRLCLRAPAPPALRAGLPSLGLASWLCCSASLSWRSSACSRSTSSVWRRNAPRRMVTSSESPALACWLMATSSLPCWPNIGLAHCGTTSGQQREQQEHGTRTIHAHTHNTIVTYVV